MPVVGSPRVFLTSMGCKLNQSETESWVRGLSAAGCLIVENPVEADLCVLNSCAVTHVAGQKSRQAVRHLHRSNPRAQILLTGCYAETDPDEARRLDGCTITLGCRQKDRVIEWVKQNWSLLAPESQLSPAPAHALRTRALVKIQDGCDNLCSYCIVRIARGPQRSRATADVLQEIAQRCGEGYQEIVLTGVHIGAYGREFGSSLRSLTQAILATGVNVRLRLSSIEPWDLDHTLFALWEDRRMCRHLHLPLQSGCDATLARMNRHYTTAQFRSLVDEARRAIPDLAVTTDVIVGFPGEDAEEFAQSAQFARDLKLSRIHVFPFSGRPGTLANSMDGQVTPPVRKARAGEMNQISRCGADQFRTLFVGRTLQVLWETQRQGAWSGLTDNYIRVWTNDSRPLRNRITATRLTGLTADGMTGVVLE